MCPAGLSGQNLAVGMDVLVGSLPYFNTVTSVDEGTLGDDYVAHGYDGREAFVHIPKTGVVFVKAARHERG
jgi:hypothetical protein